MDAAHTQRNTNKTFIEPLSNIHTANI